VTQLVTEISKLIQDPAALLIVDDGKRSWLGALSWGPEMQTTDIQVFLEAIQLQKIGEF
jgi:hypothetical protein